MADLIQIAQDTAGALGAVVLEQGEPGLYTDTHEPVIGDGVTSGGILLTLNTGETSAPAAAGTQTIAMPANRRHHTLLINPLAGGGAYEWKVVLPRASRRDWDKVEVLVQMPASANPTVTFRDNAAGSASMFTIVGDGAVVRNYRVDLKFLSNAWMLFDSRQL